MTQEANQGNDGKRMERKFAAWLQEVERFDQVALNHRVTGAVSTEIYEVDVLGKRYRPFFRKVSALGSFMFLATLPTSIIVGLIDERITQIWLATLLWGGMILMIIGTQWDTFSVWVECKDIERGVTREHVAVLKHNVEDVRKKRVGWKPTRVYLVAKRFDQNALRLALSYKFRCLQETESGFQDATPPIT